MAGAYLTAHTRRARLTLRACSALCGVRGGQAHIIRIGASMPYGSVHGGGDALHPVIPWAALDGGGGAAHVALVTRGGRDRRRS